MIIALSGYGRAGKDSIADILVEDYGFKRYAWADTLRLAASALDPIVGTDEHGAVYRYNEVLADVGYNQAKIQFPEVRIALQRLGTEVGRELIGDNVWVDATFRRIDGECSPDDGIVITDCRFPNEAHAVKGRGGFVVRVERPGIEAVNDHPSETSLDDWPFDMWVRNNGSLDALDSLVKQMYDHLKNLHSGLQLF